MDGRRRRLSWWRMLVLVAALVLGVIPLLSIVIEAAPSPTSSGLNCPDGRENLAILEAGDASATSPEEVINGMDWPPEMRVPLEARHLAQDPTHPDNGIVRGSGPGVEGGNVWDVYVSSRLYAKLSISPSGSGGWYLSGLLWCPAAT